MIRLFAALSVPNSVRETLAQAQSGLVGARWSPVDNLHLTLSFFGDVPEVQAEDLNVALLAIRAAPFDLQLT